MRVDSNVTVYKCDFCKKKLFRKHAMEHHEEFCYSNPVNTPACSGCRFLKEEQKEIYLDGQTEYGYIEHKRMVKSFKCSLLNKELYPLSAARKGLPKKYPETFEDAELMPANCNDFKPH